MIWSHVGRTSGWQLANRRTIGVPGLQDFQFLHMVVGAAPLPGERSHIGVSALRRSLVELQEFGQRRPASEENLLFR
jgi:hypothetical protein